ncbi:hypothetical protein NI389_05705 [Pseudoalteromonas xiamenensis]|uniref:hypothetical protein n=1 Tax=Pseudoalteromonas xiamenensis TaxID=882626 RepID=UPI0027E449A0|nr:hypothetical protein [Pseudoalteromonas xiamenensis]WMN60903.1 hypothetical protein NI389_05705 [Pseudoalteromonas xiamenensis]
MKLLVITFLLFCYSFSLDAKVLLPDTCQDLTEVTENSLILLNKKEFIELGECIGAAQIKTKRVNWIPEACSEIKEDESSILGVFSLSKKEALQIGMCVGVINAVFTRYDNERVLSYSSRDRKYQCIRGKQAIDIMLSSSKVDMNREDVRELLCKEVLIW